MTLHLRLLGAQDEYFCGGLVIWPAEEDARAEAHRLQIRWFAAPDSLDAKQAYAKALRRWARIAHNADAMAHANKLLQECAAACLVASQNGGAS